MKVEIRKTIVIDVKKILEGLELLKSRKTINKIIRREVQIWGRFKLIEGGWPERELLYNYVRNILIHENYVK